ncbi:NUDIX hydrolase [Gymnodinialimonas sp. 57CJ19]|uniref:NUDIX hydrolase n=1 Tax=Gymnodinialimonas sp. 57CJ19 TaxID=3138498 RepID=UPI0031344928
MNRRFGHWPDPAQTYRPRPGIYAIIDAGDGLLASFQDAPTPELQLPGGGIDPGEQPLAALHREVMEETGYRIHSPRRLGMFHRYTFMPDYDRYAHKQCHIYVAQLGRRWSAPTEPHHTAVFLPWDVALEKLAVSGDRYFLSQYLAGA